MSTLNDKTVAHITLGCKVNMYDTQAMIEILKNNGAHVVDFEDRADIYIINTCTVTNFGDKKSRQALRKAAKLNPEAVIVACGCYSQVDSETVKAIDGVDILIGTKDRMRIAEFILQYLEGKKQKNFVSNISNQTEFEDLSISNSPDKARAYIKIQEGCDNYCSYCIIPYARGPVRSRNPDNVIIEAKKLAASGCKEIVLAGIHVGNYGKDINDGRGINLAGILRELHEIDGIERIRFGSIEPRSVTDELLKVFADCHKLCDHVHLSLQSGCNRTLTAMNRRYNTAEYEAVVTSLRAIMPDLGITTDIIVGFPEESDKDFQESLAFVKRMGFSKVHVFPYSPKTGTKAALMDNHVPSQIKSERAKEMSALGDALAHDFAKRFEQTKLPVLFEQAVGQNIYEGHSRNYLVVRQQSTIDLTNQILEVEIAHAEGSLLHARNVFIKT